MRNNLPDYIKQSVHNAREENYKLKRKLRELEEYKKNHGDLNYAIRKKLQRWPLGYENSLDVIDRLLVKCDNICELAKKEEGLADKLERVGHSFDHHKEFSESFMDHYSEVKKVVIEAGYDTPGGSVLDDLKRLVSDKKALEKSQWNPVDEM